MCCKTNESFAFCMLFLTNHHLVYRGIFKFKEIEGRGVIIKWFLSACVAGKSSLVLFYDMNSYVQYEVSTTWLFQLTLFCLYWLPFISYILTYVIISSLVIINCDNAHPTVTGILWLSYEHANW